MPASHAVARKEGRVAMRRFGWQIGGVSVALVLLVALGLLAFGCGSGSRAPGPSPTPRVTPHATPTADPRVAEVEAAARRYVQALADSMKTGSPTELDSLSVPGSQAAGNAGITAHIVRDTGKTFVATVVTISDLHVELASSAATATLDYSLEGYDAAWPSLRPLGSDRTLQHHESLELDLVQGQWLVATAS